MSSKNENRRINIYINGKEVENTIKSIRSEARKLSNEIDNNLTPGTKKYNQAVKELKRLNGVLDDHREKVRGTEGVWGKIKKEVKQFGIIAAGAMGVGAMVAGVQKLVKSSATLDEQLADVRKVTGLTKDEVKELASELKKIDTRSSRGELLELSWVAGKLGIQGKEDILGFVRAADQINVALGSDLGAGAVQQIGKMVSIFNLEEEYGIEKGMLKIASAINEIGMASTASEGFLVNFTKRMSGISGLANISAADNIALAGTLDSLGQTAETSSTAISKALIQMGKKTENFAKIAQMELEDFRKLMAEDTLEALLLVLEKVGQTEGGMEQLTEVLGDLGADGGRIVGVLGTLSGNIDEVRRQQELANKAFDDGQSVTDEFAIKNQTLGAVLAKLRKEIARAIAPIELIEKIKIIIFWLSENIRSIIDYIKFTIKLGAVILTFIGTMKTLNAVLLIYNNRQKAGIALTTAQRLATILLYKAKKILAMNISTASKAMQLFNLVTKLNPLGALLGVLAAVTTAFALFKDNAMEATAAQKEFNAAVEEGNRLADATEALEHRVKTLDRLSKEQKLKLLEDIDQEIMAHKDKQATLLAEEVKSYGAIIQERKKHKDNILRLEQEKAHASDAIQLEMLEKQIQLSQTFLEDTKDFILKNNQGITDSEVNENIKRLENWRSLVEQKINASQSLTDSEKETLATRQKDLEAFYAFLDKMRTDNFLKSLSDKERAIEQIKLKYQEQLELAAEHWGLEHENYLELLALQQAEIDGVKLQYAEEFHEQYMAFKNELWLDDFEDGREKALAEIALEEEKELAKYAHFEEFEDLKTLILEKYRRKRLDVNKKFDDAELNNKKAKAAQERDIQLMLMNNTANLLGSIAGLMQEHTGAWKVLKIAEAKISMFSAIQKAYESAMELPFPANVIVGATSIAAATMQGMKNVMQIRRTEIPSMPNKQFKSGGFDVVGPDDGKKYKASFLNQKGGHVGKNGPNLVLGGEEDPEYWIPGDMMKEPFVERIAHALEAYRTHQVSTPDFRGMMQQISLSQMKTGGYSVPAPSPSSTENNNDFNLTVQEMTAIMKELKEVMENPPPSLSILDYDYFEKETDFINSIKENARG